jgi:hypothetical protein
MKRAVVLVIVWAGAARAQSNPAAQAARQWRIAHEHAIVDEFVSLLSIPNIATDRPNIQRNAELIQKMMEKRGIASQLISVSGSNPVVFGEIKTPGATRTIVSIRRNGPRRRLSQPCAPDNWKKTGR